MTIKCPKGQHEGFSKKLVLRAILDNMNGLMWGWQCTCSENQTAAAFLALINTTMVLPAHVSVWAVRCIYLQTSMFHTRFTLPALQWRIAFLQSYIFRWTCVEFEERENPLHAWPVPWQAETDPNERVERFLVIWTFSASDSDAIGTLSDNGRFSNRRQTLLYIRGQILLSLINHPF